MLLDLGHGRYTLRLICKLCFYYWICKITQESKYISIIFNYITYNLRLFCCEQCIRARYSDEMGMAVVFAIQR